MLGVVLGKRGVRNVLFSFSTSRLFFRLFFLGKEKTVKEERKGVKHDIFCLSSFSLSSLT
jgi:hypothetical protein